MTSEEIKKALLDKCKIAHIDKAHNLKIVYEYAQAWRVSVDKYGKFVSSLELVSAGNCPSITIAKADECELWGRKI